MMRTRKSYATFAAACIALVLTFQLSPPSAARAATGEAGGTYAAGAEPQEEEGAYYYFVVTYAEGDKRVTSTFYATGSNLRVNKKLRQALNDFTGDIIGYGGFATREEADQDKTVNAAGLPQVSVADPLG